MYKDVYDKKKDQVTVEVYLDNDYEQMKNIERYYLANLEELKDLLNGEDNIDGFEFRPNPSSRAYYKGKLATYAKHLLDRLPQNTKVLLKTENTFKTPYCYCATLINHKDKYPGKTFIQINILDVRNECQISTGFLVTIRVNFQQTAELSPIFARTLS